MKTDIEIAREAKIKNINDIAATMGLSPEDIEHYGKYKAKLPLQLIDEEKVKKAKLVLVSATSPTPAGEGKTTVSIGLAQGLNKRNRKATVVLREPSLGPVFGVKGGAAGGGYAQVLPMEDINLHFTGDFAAIEKANNLLSTMIDNNIQNKKNSLCIDPRTVVWKRVMDMNDRSLRNVITGLGGTSDGIPRETGFDITAASEVMAIICLSTSISDLKQRLGNIFVGFTCEHKPVYARDLNAHGAMAALLKDAIKPNLVQTIEGTPAIIHGGPFANIAQGTNSLLATKMAMSMSDYVVTEAGFGFDLGAEKFLDIKCQASGLIPNAAVIVTTARALRYHGGVAVREINEPNLSAIKKGIANLEKHVENATYLNIRPVVAINRFATDMDDEINYIIDYCKRLGVEACTAEVWAKGGNGALELADKVLQAIDKYDSPYKPVYDWNWSPERKIAAIAQKIYGASDVEYTPKAVNDLKKIYGLGLDKLAVCIAKTQKSLSDNPSLLGRPSGFVLTVREIEIAAGAGFIVPITGEMMRMPGLPEVPSAEHITIDDDGNICGLS